MRDMASPTPTSSSVERSRRYRQRKRERTILVLVEINAEAIDGLVRFGFLDQTDIGDRDQIGIAVALILDGLSKDALDIEPSWVASLPCARRVLDRLLSMISIRRRSVRVTRTPPA